MEQLARSAARFRNNLSRQSVRPERLQASFRTLLSELTVEEAAQLADRPSDPDVFELLTYPDGSDQESVLALLCRLDAADQLDWIDAAEELERLAIEAAAAALELGNLIVPQDHHGDRAINEWIGAMLGIYRHGGQARAGNIHRLNVWRCGRALIKLLAAAAEPAESQIGTAILSARTPGAAVSARS